MHYIERMSKTVKNLCKLIKILFDDAKSRVKPRSTKMIEAENNMKEMETLKDMVTSVVNNFNYPTFSTYDITCRIRQLVEYYRSFQEFDIPLSSPMSKRWYEIEHDAVNRIVQDMFREGKLTRTLSGDGSHVKYYEYSKPITNATQSQLDTLPEYIISYLKNTACGFASAKRIQSALKRKGNFTCKQISSITDPRIEIFEGTCASRNTLSVIKFKR
jgi:hypothetical protein